MVLTAGSNRRDVPVPVSISFLTRHHTRQTWHNCSRNYLYIPQRPFLVWTQPNPSRNMPFERSHHFEISTGWIWISLYNAFALQCNDNTMDKLGTCRSTGMAQWRKCSPPTSVWCVIPAGLLVLALIRGISVFLIPQKPTFPNSNSYSCMKTNKRWWLLSYEYSNFVFRMGVHHILTDQCTCFLL